MLEKQIKIEGMSCGHCVSAVENLLNEINGVRSYTVDLPDNVKVVFDETEVSLGDIKKNINDTEIYKAI